MLFDSRGNYTVCITVRKPIMSKAKLLFWASLVAQMVKNLPAMLETQVQSLGWNDALEKGMATHPSVLAWRIPWTEELSGLQSMGSQRMGQNLATSLSKPHFH